MNNYDDMPKVAVVIPVYKVKKDYLIQCVDSIINQTYKNLQIILVDDCSPDDCGKWCDDFAKVDDRIEVYHHEVNKKLPEARNTGIDHLNAEWVTFVDSDDWLDLDTIEKSIDCIQNQQEHVDFVFFPICRNYKEYETEPNYHSMYVFDNAETIEKLQIDSLEIAKKHTGDVPRMNDSACGKIIATKLLSDNNIRFRNLAYREDGMFFMEICQVSEYVLAVPSGKYHYRETEGSMVNSFRENAPYEQKAYLDMVISFAKKNAKTKTFFEAINYYSIVGIQTAIIQYYYNQRNKITHRHQECIKYLKQEPFKTGLKSVEIKKLNLHFAFKTFFMKIHWFSIIEKTRRVYLSRKKMVTND